MPSEIGPRVRGCIEDARLSQGEVAASVGLTDAQLSKSLNGTRSFSAVELAELAAKFRVSLHWLVTGEDDLNAYRVVARHRFYHADRSHSPEGLEHDRQLLDDVALVYRQAYS